MGRFKMYLKVNLIGLVEWIRYILLEIEKPRMTVICLYQTTWVDEARDQVCRGLKRLVLAM